MVIACNLIGSSVILYFVPQSYRVSRAVLTGLQCTVCRLGITANVQSRVASVHCHFFRWVFRDICIHEEE